MIKSVIVPAGMTDGWMTRCRMTGATRSPSTAQPLSTQPLIRQPPCSTKIALVTGSTSGIGRGIAEHFASLGARVVVHGRTRRRRGAVATAARRSKGWSSWRRLAGDLVDVEACRHIVRFTVEQFGGIDILVNNAATTSRAYLEDASGRVLGPDRCTSICARRSCACRRPSQSMRARGGGSIVNIGSVNAYIGEPKLGRTRCRRAV